MKRYGLALLFVAVLLLAMGIGSAVGAPACNVDCPPTETVPPATDTPVPPPTDITYPPPEWTGTPGLQTQYPTPTVETPAPDPTATETPGAGNPPGEKHPTPTWDCAREYNPEKCLAPTGSGDNPRLALGMTGIVGVMLVFVAFLARRARNAIR